MSDNYGLQLSVKLGDDMVNVRGNTPEEFEKNRAAMEAAADAILDTVDKFRQVALAKGLTKAGFTPAPAATDTAHSTSAAGSTAVDLRCSHGPYNDLKGKRNKKNEAYKYRYYCPGPFGQGCKAEALPGQEAGS